MKNKQDKREGFYMNINSEERNIIDKLQEQYAINISQAFKLFLKQLLEKMEKKI
jgi:hypothetical protein